MIVPALTPAGAALALAFVVGVLAGGFDGFKVKELAVVVEAGVVGFVLTAGSALGKTPVVLAGVFAFCFVGWGGMLFSILTVTEFETPAG